MRGCQTSLCVAVLLSLSQHAAAALTDYVQPCSAVDPLLNDCVLDRAKIMWPALVKGVKELGLVPMEPLYIPLVRLQEGQTDSGRGMDINLTNTKNYGWKDCVLRNVTIDPLRNHYEFMLYFPRYELIGDYQIKGRVLVLPIAGHGATNVTIGKLLTRMVVDGKPEVRNGKKYMKVTKLKAGLEIQGKTHLTMDNLFGNKELSDGMNRFINEHSTEVFEEFRPAIEGVISEIYIGMLNNFFRKVPYNRLFLDMP